MIVPVKCNVKCVDLSILPNGIMMADTLLNLCGAYTDAGQKILTNFFSIDKNQFLTILQSWNTIFTKKILCQARFS